MPSVEDKESHPSVAKMKFHPESMCCSGEEGRWSNVIKCLVAEFVFLTFLPAKSITYVQIDSNCNCPFLSKSPKTIGRSKTSDPRDGGFPGGSTWVGWGDNHVPWTCRHGWCYARSWGWGGVGMILALAHMVGATQHHVSCTCTHGWCYATSCFLHLHTWSVLRNIMFLALAHMVGATKWNACLAWCLP